MAQHHQRHLMEGAVVEERLRSSIVCVSPQRYPALREFASNRHAAFRSQPTNGTATEGLPADGESPHRPKAQTDPGQGRHSNPKTPQYEQTDGQTTEADRGDCNTAKREDRANRRVTSRNPGHDWPAFQSSAKPNMDERQAKQTELASVFEERDWAVGAHCIRACGVATHFLFAQRVVPTHPPHREGKYDQCIRNT